MSLAGLLGRGFFDTSVLGGGGALTLSVADNGDDTGATATVGDTDGEEATFFAANWSGALAGAVFTEAGSRVGDGSAVLALAAGYWWVYAVTVAGAISPVVGVRVTTGDEQLFDRILDAIVAKIQALSLPGLTSANITKGKAASNPGGLSDGAQVTPAADNVDAQYNNRDRKTFTAKVTFFRASNRNQSSNLGDYLFWRDKASDAFRFDSSLPAVPEVYDVHVEYGAVLAPEVFAQNYDAGALYLHCIVTSTRGV